MTDTKFTQGPWRAWQPRGDESVPVRTEGLGITIAYVHQGAITNARANASLIAAAPDLYEALEAAIEEINHLRKFAGDNGAMIDDTDFVEGIAALAKARGEA